MHVDVESCTYWRASLQVDAHTWTSIVQNEQSPGTLIDIKVLLPDEDIRWEISVRRTIQHEYMDTSRLPSEKVKLDDDIDEESLRAFDVLNSVDCYGVRVPLYLVHLVDQSRQPMKLILVAPFPRLCWTKSLITLKPGECSETTNGYLGNGRICLRIVESHFPMIRKIYQNTRALFRLPESDKHALSTALGQFITASQMNPNTGDTAKPRMTCFGFRTRRQDHPPRGQRVTGRKVSVYIWIMLFIHVSIADHGRHHTNQFLAYLDWPVYRRETTRPHVAPNARGKFRNTRNVIRRRPELPKGAVEPRRSDGSTSAISVDTSPMAQLHRALSNKKFYKEQDTRSNSEVDSLIQELISAGSVDLVAFAADAKALIEHFVPATEDSPVKQKAFGALRGILEVTLWRTPHYYHGANMFE